jgi:hypothetical protein
VANQTRFVMARDALADKDQPLSPADRRKRIDEITHLVEKEIALARELFRLSRLDSMLGYETFCQYFYLPLDLVEKVVNCQHVLDRYANESKDAPNVDSQEFSRPNSRIGRILANPAISRPPPSRVVTLQGAPLFPSRRPD